MNTWFIYLVTVMKHTYTLLILCMVGTSTIAQHMTASDTELEAFVHIYLSEKEQHADTDDMIQALLDKHGVTAERYGEILAGSIISEKLVLSKQEDALMVSIAEQRRKHNKSLDRHTKRVCRDYPLTFERYVQLRQAYRSDPAFQHRLKPFFHKAIRELHQLPAGSSYLPRSWCP